MSEPPRYSKRLIEVDLPIKRVSAHARREKTIHPGHISTLHIWWARRPLAACRAVICAALWPDPADALCPESFRLEARNQMSDWAAKHLGRCSADSFQRFARIQAAPEALADSYVLRTALLDFIADFADWDNATASEFLNASHAITQAAHEACGGAKNSRPLVFDPFAGGGAIPLEALRIGADAFATDLNPLPILQNKIILEYIPKYGGELLEKVEQWGEWLKREARQRLTDFYPTASKDSIPVAYLWARTIRCEGPGCGNEIPLIRNLQISRDGRRWHYLVRHSPAGRIDAEIAEGALATGRGTVKGGSAECPIPGCGYTTPAKAVREQLAQRHGGASDARLLAVLEQTPGGRVFRKPTDTDLAACRSASERLDRDRVPHDSINSIRPYKNTRGLSAVTRIGLSEFGDLYTPRQALAIQVVEELVIRAAHEMDDSELSKAVSAVLLCAASRLIFQNCSLSRWNAGRSTIEGAFGKQALQVVWDFAESNPISDGPASISGAIEWVTKVINNTLCIDHPGAVVAARAQDQILSNDSVDALITDPPYFAAIPYGDLSNVFFVWEREVLRVLFPELARDGLVDQRDEIIVTNAHTGPDGSAKSPEYYEREMTRALESARKATKSTGIGVVVFAEGTPGGWETMLNAIIQSGWSITGSWPIDTELQARTQAAGSASLQSSVHIVCRPREDSSGALTINVGDWRQVLAELPDRMHLWMRRLADEGVVGADAIFACLGPALEIFSRYSHVERATGEVVSLREYLEQVWAAVSREALSMIFADPDTADLDEEARLTAMWLWTIVAPTGAPAGSSEPEDEDDASEDEDQAAESAARKSAPGFALEFDAARKIAQSLGARLDTLSHVVQVKGDKARLLSVGERTAYLFGRSDGALATKKASKKRQQRTLFEELEEVAEEQGWGEVGTPKAGSTTLDRVHQAMILFGAGRSEAMKRFLVDEGVGRGAQFWKLAQALSALYPTGTDEKRWVDGVLARKKGLGF